MLSWDKPFISCNSLMWIFSIESRSFVIWDLLLHSFCCSGKKYLSTCLYILRLTKIVSNHRSILRYANGMQLQISFLLFGTFWENIFILSAIHGRTFPVHIYCLTLSSVLLTYSLIFDISQYFQYIFPPIWVLIILYLLQNLQHLVSLFCLCILRSL